MNRRCLIIRIYFNKKHIKISLIVICSILAVVVLLKLISIWDSRQMISNIDSVNTTAPPNDTGQTDTDPNSPEKSEYELRLDTIMADANALRDEYVTKLETMYTDAETSLTELVDNEGSDDDVASLVSEYLTEVTVLEQQCDAKFDVIVNELDQLIKNNNGDKSLLDDLIETYITEKATKKAWYLDRLEEKGLIS